MSTSLRAYADAYIESLPKEADVIRDFDAVADVIQKTKQLRSFLEDVSVPISARRDALKEAFPSATSETVNFLTLLAQDGRAGELEALKTHIRSASAGKKGKRHALVTSASPLTAQDLDRIAKSLGKKLGTDIQLEEQTDPSLLAGFRISSDGWTFDASLKGKLDRLQHALTV
jgi:F-type H+-transporting ATPase subunit delta